MSFVSLLGFDTVSTALSWSVSYLVTYPELQERLHEEISEFCYTTFHDNSCVSQKQKNAGVYFRNTKIIIIIIRIFHCPVLHKPSIIYRGQSGSGSHTSSLWQTKPAVRGGLHVGVLSPFVFSALHNPSLVRPIPLLLLFQKCTKLLMSSCHKIKCNMYGNP